MEANFHCKYDAALFKSMMLFLYHGCLRYSEIGKSSDVRHALLIQNVMFITERGETSLSFTLETYKSSSGPVTFRLNKTEDPQFCPVIALVNFLRVRIRESGLLFLRETGNPVTRDWFAKQLKRLIAIAGLDEGTYNTHSFRAGRTTDLAAEGFTDLLIKETGRWNSNAYLKYVRFECFILPR